MKRLKTLVSVVLSISILFSVSFAEFDTHTIDLFRQMLQELYYKDLTDEELEEAAIKGLFNSLDPYTVYYNKEEASEFEEAVSGTYVGIGIKMESLNGYINVNQVFNNSSAKNAGVLPQDRILAVEGESVVGWSTSKAASVIRGPEGTFVKITFGRGAEKYEVSLERRQVQVDSCSLDILEDNIGYIKVEEFNATTYAEFASMIKTLKVCGVKKLILDLRDNNGGYLSQCIAAAKLIVQKGKIVTIQYRDPEEDTTYRSSLDHKDFDIVTLVNGNTASASEIVAGALKDSGAATLVGKKTFGKGIVQQMYNLKNGGAVKVTVAEYVTRNDNHIHGVGIEPDIEIDGEEEQLNKALELLRNK